MLLRSTLDQAVWVSAPAGDNVFLGKTLYPHSASLHPGVQMSTSKFNAGGNPAMGRHSGLMDQSACPWSERSGFESWPGTLFCVLGQYT